MHAISGDEAIRIRMNVSYLEPLEHLSDACEKCARQYEAAALRVRERQLRESFLRMAEQWGNFGWDLREELGRLERESYWSHPRATEWKEAELEEEIDPGNSTEEMIERCCQLEEEALKQYTRVLEGRALPHPVEMVVHRHRAEIQRANGRHLPSK